MDDHPLYHILYDDHPRDIGDDHQGCGNPVTNLFGKRGTTQGSFERAENL